MTDTVFGSSVSVPVRQQFLAILASALALILGVMAGYLLGVSGAPQPPTILREDTRPLIPVVRIDGIDGAELTGVALGEVRLFHGERQILTSGSGAFRVRLPGITAAVPSGMRFVASKRGTKYYPAGSPSAQRLSSANVLYFRDAAAAEAAGYVASR